MTGILTIEEAANDPRLHDKTLKMRFAHLWAQRPDQIHRAVYETFNDPALFNLTFAAMQLWQNDPEVLAEKARLNEKFGAAVALPSREQFALELYEIAKKALTVTDKLRAMDKLGDVLGFTSKSGSPGNPLAVVVQRVMEVPHFKDEAEWSEGLQQQQAKLIDDAREQPVKH